MKALERYVCRDIWVCWETSILMSHEEKPDESDFSTLIVLKAVGDGFVSFTINFSIADTYIPERFKGFEMIEICLPIKHFAYFYEL